MKHISVFLVFSCLLFFLSGCDFEAMRAENEFSEKKQVSETSQNHDEETDLLNDYTDEQILSVARELYQNCLLLTGEYLSGSAYSVDDSGEKTIEGKTVKPVMDDSVLEFEDIYFRWLSVFSSKYFDKNDQVFSGYFTEDSKIWAVTEPYLPDESYLDTVIIKVTARNGNEAEVNAVSSYQAEDGSIKKKENVFSVVYSSDTFKAGKFTMPY